MRPHRHREVNHADFIRAYRSPSFLRLSADFSFLCFTCFALLFYGQEEMEVKNKKEQRTVPSIGVARKERLSGQC